MTFSFSSMTFSDEELKELFEALLMRTIVEDELRMEEGLEPAHRHLLLDKVEEIVLRKGLKPEAIEASAEDELWRHAWYAVTDEFAWRRAREETIKELGESAESMREERIERLARRKYENRFNDYVAEIERLYGVQGEKSKK